MNLLRSAGAIAAASGDGTIDWEATVAAATAMIDPGSLDLDPGERAGYAADVRAARDRVREVSGLDFDLPGTIELQHRHHWIEANASTFEELMRPLAEQPVALPGVARRMNTATMAGMLGFLGRHVLGQYDPLLLTDREPRLYFVRPNVKRIAGVLDVEYDRFRRWIVFHEVTHVAEFEASPWLSASLETEIEGTIETLAEGEFDREAFADLNATMTAVEGYAEFVMDRAFDEEYTDLREKVEARRRGGGVIARLVRRLLGFGLKRQQYEQGKAFFDHVAEKRGTKATAAVWRDQASLPTHDEIEDPATWLRRVDP